MYYDRKLRRGDIYRVRLDTGWDSEQGATRPAVIISSNIGNDTSPVVIVAYMTTKPHDVGVQYGPTRASGAIAYVCCNQIATVSKNRLIGNIMGSFSDNEMREIDNRLDEVLDLGWVDDSALKEKEKECAALEEQLKELKSKNAELAKKYADLESELLTKDVEIDVAKRMYERAVGMIAVKRMKLPERKSVELPKLEPDSGPVDINTAQFSELRNIGLTNNIIANIIHGRPYKTVEDLKNIPGMNAKLYGIMENRVCCVPVQGKEPEEPNRKVNVNTASPEELHEVLGLNITTCGRIRAYRNKNGQFEKLEDLLNVPRIYPGTLERLGHLMEV